MIEGPILDVEVIGFLVRFAVAMPHSHSNGPPFSKHQKNFFSPYYKTWKYYETLADDTYPYLGLHTKHFQSYICEVSMLD